MAERCKERCKGRFGGKMGSSFIYRGCDNKLSPKAKYCSLCGTKKGATRDVQEESRSDFKKDCLVQCKFCGASCQLSANFCEVCGTHYQKAFYLGPMGFGDSMKIWLINVKKIFKKG